ncbi:hypothetical protein M9Y10_011012 [Tritrichomonas musculus]|uniref:Sel1 repeat family protein n=1 Tax=Tritrichomonas musculus TaxID=1915356 RepID=A0ABR2INV2_9EUKA
MLASNNGDRIANFAHGFLLHEKNSSEKDIEDAIHFYKEASSFNIQFAKNNLGIIYKHGYYKNERRLWNAIEYFKEAIRQKNDYLSMYNLAHIYMYDDSIKCDFNKLIELLINSSKQFYHSIILLYLLLVKQFGFNIEKIKQEIEKITDETSNLYEKIQNICVLNLSDKSKYDYLYELYRNNDFIYNIEFHPIQAFVIRQKKVIIIPSKYPNAKDISSEFYDGFGHDLINSS